MNISLKNIIFLDKLINIFSGNFEMASSAGLEPATHCLEGSCSNPTELRGEA